MFLLKSDPRLDQAKVPAVLKQLGFEVYEQSEHIGQWATSHDRRLGGIGRVHVIPIGVRVGERKTPLNEVRKCLLWLFKWLFPEWLFTDIYDFITYL